MTSASSDRGSSAKKRQRGPEKAPVFRPAGPCILAGQGIRLRIFCRDAVPIRGRRDARCTAPAMAPSRFVKIPMAWGPEGLHSRPICRSRAGESFGPCAAQHHLGAGSQASRRKARADTAAGPGKPLNVMPFRPSVLAFSLPERWTAPGNIARLAPPQITQPDFKI